MPKEMREESHVVGIEMDALSARIAKAAHKDVEIFHQSFQNSHFANGSFDLAIGNVPFGDSPIYGDSAYEGQGLLPHDYFLLKMLDATLTLPGVAGIILSIGMAVDANVLIFEHFKEEYRLGKTLRLSMEAGFKRAFTTIFDSNITTIIAALVLFFFGTGTIKGFAITLGLGVVLSMLTAITLTQYMLKLLIASNICKNPAVYGATGLTGGSGVKKDA